MVLLGGCEPQDNGDMIRLSIEDHSQTERIQAVRHRLGIFPKGTLFQPMPQPIQTAVPWLGRVKQFEPTAFDDWRRIRLKCLPQQPVQNARANSLSRRPSNFFNRDKNVVDVFSGQRRGDQNRRIPEEEHSLARLIDKLFRGPLNKWDQVKPRRGELCVDNEKENIALMQRAMRREPPLAIDEDLSLKRNKLRPRPAMIAYCPLAKRRWIKLYGRDEVLRSNQALERTAARRVFTFQMIKTVSVDAALALDGGRSACSR
jgi:hypothetical protein